MLILVIAHSRFEMTITKPVILLLTSLAIACTNTRKADVAGGIDLSQDAEKTKKSVLAVIPTGTNVTKAKELLVGTGFECSFLADERGDYLYGSLERSDGAFVGTRWQILIFYKDGATVDADVAVGFVGL